MSFPRIFAAYFANRGHAPPSSRPRKRLRGEINSTAWTIIAALGIAATVAMVSQGQDERRKAAASIEVDNLMVLKEAVIGSYGTTFTNLGSPTQAQLAVSGFPPGKMIVGATVVNGRNGAVNLVGQTNTFDVTSASHTKEDCLAIGGRFSQDASVSEIAVTSGTPVTMTRAGGQFPLTAANQVALCNAATVDMRLRISP